MFCDDLEGWNSGQVGSGVGRRLKREGIYVYKIKFLKC